MLRKTAQFPKKGSFALQSMVIHMKYEIGTQKPDNLKEYWPGQYDFFSHFEYVSGIPHALFLITTRKENGNANACFASWSCFSGDSG